MLRDRRAIVDTGVGPVAFVTVNAIAGLEPAAAVAVGIQLLIAAERLIRRRPVTNAIGGLLGTGLAVLFAVSAAIRRPIVGYLIGALYRAPSEWTADPRVRRAFSEVTFAWAGLFAFRALVYLVLISAGKTGWLAVASVAMGWPA